MKRCIVTGAAGFIGSHLCDRLLALGHEVTGIDSLATGRKENLAQAIPNPRFRLVLGDVADAATIAPHFQGVDWVFHLAALADIVPSIQRPLEYHHANVDGTIGVLEASRAAGVRRFLYVASSSCYGLPDEVPTSEEAELRPQYPYALTKRMGEQLALFWGKLYDLPVISLRFFNVYGPRSRTTGAYGAVFGVFLAQKLHGQPFTVVGDGKQTRDFTFVSDVVDAITAAIASDVKNEILNVGSGATQSVNRLVELLGGDVVHIPKRPGEPDCTLASITKIERLLGWRPRVKFEDGVRVMLENIESFRQAPLWTPTNIAEATKDWFAYLSK
jgi:UDP-glucose 4-epimerase